MKVITVVLKGRQPVENNSPTPDSLNVLELLQMLEDIDDTTRLYEEADLAINWYNPSAPSERLLH